MKIATLVAVVSLLSATSAFAMGAPQPGLRSGVPDAAKPYTPYILHQARADDLCRQVSQKAQTCYERWQSMGGGKSRQAGSFYDCMTVYCKGAIAGGCVPLPEACE